MPIPLLKVNMLGKKAHNLDDSCHYKFMATHAKWAIPHFPSQLTLPASTLFFFFPFFSLTFYTSSPSAFLADDLLYYFFSYRRHLQRTTWSSQQKMLHPIHICTHIFCLPPATQDETLPVLPRAMFFICALNLIMSFTLKDFVPTPQTLILNSLSFSVKTYSLEATISPHLLRIHWCKDDHAAPLMCLFLILNAQFISKSSWALLTKYFRTTIVCIHLHEVPKVGKFIDIKLNCGYQGVEGGNKGELVFNAYKISVWNDEKFRGCIVAMITWHCKCTSYHELDT